MCASYWYVYVHTCVCGSMWFHLMNFGWNVSKQWLFWDDCINILVAQPPLETILEASRGKRYRVVSGHPTWNHDGQEVPTSYLTYCPYYSRWQVGYDTSRHQTPDPISDCARRQTMPSPMPSRIPFHILPHPTSNAVVYPIPYLLPYRTFISMFRVKGENNRELTKALGSSLARY